MCLWESKDILPSSENEKIVEKPVQDNHWRKKKNTTQNLYKVFQ